MYRLSGRQILGIALGAALFAAVTAVGLQQLAGRLLPVGSAFSTTAPAPIADLRPVRGRDHLGLPVPASIAISAVLALS